MALSGGRALWLAGALSASLVSMAGGASGQVPADVPSVTVEQADGEPAIVLMFEPGQPDSDRLVRAIESHLVGLPVRVVLEPLERGEILEWFESGHLRAKAHGAIGLFAIEAGRRDLWRLYFLDMDGAPTLIRRLRPSPEHAPLDDAGVAVRLLVEALLDARPLELGDPAAGGSSAASGSPARSLSGRRRRSSARKESVAGSAKAVTAPPSEPAPAESDPSDAPETEPQPRRAPGPFGFFLGPVGTTWVAGQAWQFGARGGAEVHLKATWSVSLDYTWYPTASLELEGASLAWDRHPIAAQAAYRPSAGISPRFWLGLWGDAVSRKTLASAAPYVGTTSVTTWSWGPGGGVGLATPSSWSFNALLDVGLDIATQRVEYVVESATQQAAATTGTRIFRPSVSLRVGWRP